MSSPKKINIKVLGCGTYGCAVKPVIVFKDATIDIEYTDKERTDIGKIFKIDDDIGTIEYKDELKELELIKSIDPSDIFTVPLKGANYGNILEEQYNIKDLTSLYELIEYEKDVDDIKIHQIILGYGGSELNNRVVFKRYKITYSKFIKIFDKFLEGMILLQKAKMIHRDIKPPNVLLFSGEKGEKLNLIDFGLSTNAENLYAFNNDNISMMKYEYVYYPVEYYICGAIYSNIVNKIKEDFKNKKQTKGRFNITTIITIENINDEYKKLICDEENSKFIIDDLEKLKNSTAIYNTYVNDLYYENKSNPEILKLYKEFFKIQINKFIDHIINTINISKNEKIKEILTKIYTEEIIQKFDVYSLSFIILPFYKYLSGLKGEKALNDKQKAFLSYIFNNCINSNPYDRISLIALKKLIEIELNENITDSLPSSISSVSSLSSSSSISSASSLSSFTFPSSKSTSKGGRDVLKINKNFGILTPEIPIKRTTQISLKKSDIAAYYASKINFMDYIDFDYRKAKTFKKRNL